MCTPCFILHFVFLDVLGICIIILHPFGLLSSILLDEYNMICIAIHLKLAY